LTIKQLWGSKPDENEKKAEEIENELRPTSMR
jgi:hypothetical protein